MHAFSQLPSLARNGVQSLLGWVVGSGSEEGFHPAGTAGQLILICLLPRAWLAVYWTCSASREAGERR
jgi:hypothetical protein